MHPCIDHWELTIPKLFNLTESFPCELTNHAVNWKSIVTLIATRRPSWNENSYNIERKLNLGFGFSWAVVYLVFVQFSRDGKEHVVVGTLDVNWCLQLPDELTGIKPEVHTEQIFSFHDVKSMSLHISCQKSAYGKPCQTSSYRIIQSAAFVSASRQIVKIEILLRDEKTPTGLDRRTGM